MSDSRTPASNKADRYDLVGYVRRPLLQRRNQQFKQYKLRSHRLDMPLGNGFEYAIGDLTVVC